VPGLMIASVALAVLPVLVTMRETAPQFVNEWKPGGAVDVQGRSRIRTR